MQMGEKVMNDI